MKNYFATLCRNISCLYKTIGWENPLFIQNSGEIPWVKMQYRKVGMKVEKQSLVLFLEGKMHIVSLYLHPQPKICATTFTHIWARA